MMMMMMMMVIVVAMMVVMMTRQCIAYTNSRVTSAFSEFTQHFPLLQAQIPFSRFIFTESLKYDWGDETAVFSRSRRYHSPERAPKIKYFMSKNMKIIPRKDPRLPPSWTLLGEAPKSDKNRGLHFLCKKGGKKLQYFGLINNCW